MKQQRLKLKFLFGLIISALFLGIILKKMDLHNVASVLLSIRFIYLVPVALLLPAFYLLFAYRWKQMYCQFKRKPKFSNLFRASIIGHMGNNTMPARLGELLRLYLIKKKEKTKISTTLATLVLEKIFDGLALMTFFILAIFFLKATKSHLYPFEVISATQLKFWGAIIAIAYILFMGALLLFRNRIKFFVKFHNKLFSVISKKISKHTSKNLF